jgi:hypothetical protein
VPPPNQDILQEKAKEFWKQWNFPNSVSQIDGKHIRIFCPSKTGSLFYNYKDFFSTVLLAFVDTNYKFIVVRIGSFGKEGDSGILERSVVVKALCWKPEGRGFASR